MGVDTIQLPAGYTAAHDARFKVVCDRLIGVEGKLANDPADHGGLTNYGLSLRFLIDQGHLDAGHPRFADLDLDENGVIDARDLIAMTPAKSEQVYRDCIWIPYGLWSLPEPLDGAMLDQVVNDGPAAAGKLLQRAINSVYAGAVGMRPLDVDGEVGPSTRSHLDTAVDRLGVDAVIGALRNVAEDRYRLIAARDPSQKRFLNGWIARAEGLGNV